MIVLEGLARAEVEGASIFTDKVTSMNSDSSAAPQRREVLSTKYLDLD